MAVPWGDVAVDGRFGDFSGGFWLPTTVCIGDCVGFSDGTLLGDAAGVGDTDCPPDGEGEAANEGDAAGDGETPSAKVAEAVAEVPEELGLARPTAGATKSVDDIATATASASSPATARIGTSAAGLPSGRRSRQLGQKPETGVVT